ncbi:MAG TPA: glycine--tRNA ligase subunit beta [Acidobacteriaceae bacterium]|nr:glycine--tRNA ligase subunit beta [Acidobacteriaceae bacterium]
MPAFLFEIGLEEIPASMIFAAQTELAQRVEKLLTRERLGTDILRLTSYSTPRRLAVLAEGLLPKQPDMEEEIVGPSTKVAYRDGVPTSAAMAFAKKSGVDVSALKTIQNAKGEYVSATVHRRGRTAAEVLTSSLPAEIGGIYWPKNMYWRAGKSERFVRPVRWLLALLDEEILPLEFAGVIADRFSYGHRVLHGDKPVVIRAPHEYAEKLDSAYVQVDPEARKHRIRKALDAATRQVPGARWRENEELVDTVTNLTERPTVVLGNFEQEYLTLPDEILVTVMRDHQKYFALEDAEEKLLPNFLAILNLKVDDAGAATIRHGNERVLRARFNDARFFWDMDQKIPLVDRVEMLKSVTFQKDLGSYWNKTQRNRAVARRIIDRCDPPLFDSEVKFETFCGGVDQAALLAKTDLTTEMVKEFTELQGVVGGLYARAQRLPDGVARAIYDHYKPASQTDTIPGLPAGSVVALADKISTIVDMFAIGLQPTGSKDPFALRRAGNGVVRILAEDARLNERLHLSYVCFAAMQNTKAMEDAELRGSIYDFLLDRFEFYLRETRKINSQVARAIRKAGTTGSDYEVGCHLIGYGKIAGFATALHDQVGSPNVLAVAELLKRTANILRQAREKRIAFSGNESEDLFREPAERELSRKVTEVNEAIQHSYRQGNYNDVIAAIAGLQPPLNAFFDSVMVMVEDESLRDNRLALLSRTESVVRWAADFSELASI